VRSRLQAAAARGLTRFVGRDPELDQLRQAWERAGAGQGQVVAVIGEPGVGKSRLFYEFTHSHRTHGWLLLASSSVSYGKATPYLPVIDLLKAYFGIEVHDDARKRREKVTGKLLTLERALEPTLPAFLALLEVPVEDRQWQALDPQQRRQRTLDALKRLLLRESQMQPLCVMFEDLHWIDAETQAVLDSLLDSLPTARILLLVNYRPEYQHGWGAKTYYIQLRLDPLPPASADALLAALLGHDASLEPLTRLLIARTQGNPFFLEESVRTLVETRSLVGERGAYGLAQALPTIQVPATVQAVLAARIDRLLPEDKRLLQTAAVIGTEVPLPLLQAIAEVPEEALHRSLTHLQAAEFLYETHLFPEREYTFKHALTHEVAYGSLLQERRRTLHARIVEALERLSPDRLTEQVERLTHHACRGEVWEKAVVYCRQSGAKATARAAYREAVAYFEQALEAVSRLPEQRDTRAQAIDLRLDLRNALFPLGDFGRILDLLREAESLAEALGDQGRLGRVSAFMIAAFQIRGDPDRALACGQRTLSIAEALGDAVLQMQAGVALGRLHYRLGDYRRAMHFLGRTVTALTGESLYQSPWGPGVPAAAARAVLAQCQAELGMFAEGVAHGTEGVRIAEAVDRPFGLLQVYAPLGLLYLRHGDLHQAIATLERGLSVYQAGPAQLFFPPLALALGLSYALAGRVDEALLLLEPAVEQAIPLQLMHELSPLLAALSEVYLLAGRLEEASDRARQALELACTHKQHGDQAYALRLLGEIAAHGDPPQVEPAADYYRQAIPLAEELGMRPLLAHCHYGLGTLYLKAGRLEPARLELTTAMALYRAMEMTFWLPQAEAMLARVEGP
jgi:tetratricopeptide (TPR) repeat protein